MCSRALVFCYNCLNRYKPAGCCFTLTCQCLPSLRLLPQAANLLLDETGTVKIADFGVARVMDHTGIMTAETGTYRCAAGHVLVLHAFVLSVCCSGCDEGMLHCGCAAFEMVAFEMSLAGGSAGCRQPMSLQPLALCRWMAPEVIEHNPYKEKADVFR